MKTADTSKGPGNPQVLPSALSGMLEGKSCGEECYSFWRQELGTVWKEMLRSWDTSSLKSHVWLVRLLTPWGIFHGLFLTCFRDWGYATCYVFSMRQSFVAGTSFCLIGKNMFSLALFSCLAKAVHFPWGIRLLWGQRKLIPPSAVQLAAGEECEMEGLIRYMPKGTLTTGLFSNVQLCDLQPLWKNLLCFCDACLYRIH